MFKLPGAAAPLSLFSTRDMLPLDTAGSRLFTGRMVVNLSPYISDLLLLRNPFLKAGAVFDLSATAGGVGNGASPPGAASGRGGAAIFDASCFAAAAGFFASSFDFQFSLLATAIIMVGT
jgi:hypothetical protein